jgi:hypothetical protein
MAMRISSPIETLLVNLGRYVCPIFVKQDIRSRTPHLVGTGTLFQDDDEFYLITAGHVMKDVGDGQLLIGGDNTFIKFRGDQISWEYKQGENIAYDICVIRIHPMVASKLKNFYLFSTPTDISDLAAYNKLILYAFLGYPHTKNKPQPSSVKQVEVKPYYYVLREFLDMRKLRTLDKNPTTHFALSAPFKRATNINFVRQKPPEPNGISGGGVWKIELDPETGLTRSCSLVGIGIEYIREQNAFVATKIHAAIYAQLRLKGAS